MGTEIENWKNLWKEEKSTPLDVNMLITHVNKMERRGKIERMVLLITIPMTLALLGILLPVLSNGYYLAAFTLIGLGMILILIQVYRSRFDLIHNDAELNNRSYVETLIGKLKQSLLTTSKYMWVYTFLLILGLNIGYVDILHHLELSIILRIITHVVLTAVMFFFMYYTIEKRKKKNNTEIVPLIEFLENLTP